MGTTKNNLEIIIQNNNIGELKKIVLGDEIVLSNRKFLEILIELYGKRLYFLNKSNNLIGKEFEIEEEIINKIDSIFDNPIHLSDSLFKEIFVAISYEKENNEIFSKIEEIINKNVDTTEELFKFEYSKLLKTNAKNELIEKLSLYYYKEEITKKLIPIMEQVQFNNIKIVYAFIKEEYRKSIKSMSRGYFEKRKFIMKELANNMVKLYDPETLEEEPVGTISKKVLEIEEVGAI